MIGTSAALADEPFDAARRADALHIAKAHPLHIAAPLPLGRQREQRGFCLYRHLVLHLAPMGVAISRVKVRPRLVPYVFWAYNLRHLAPGGV
jgi:hypothetical protein